MGGKGFCLAMISVFCWRSGDITGVDRLRDGKSGKLHCVCYPCDRVTVGICTYQLYVSTYMLKALGCDISTVFRIPLMQ